jgi:hypothetical protein
VEKCDHCFIVFGNAIAVLLFVVEKCDRGFVVCSGEVRSLAIINSKFFVQTDFVHYLHYYSIKMKKTQ